MILAKERNNAWKEFQELPKQRRKADKVKK